MHSGWDDPEMMLCSSQGVTSGAQDANLSCASDVNLDHRAMLPYARFIHIKCTVFLFEID